MNTITDHPLKNNRLQVALTDNSQMILEKTLTVFTPTLTIYIYIYIYMCVCIIYI